MGGIGIEAFKAGLRKQASGSAEGDYQHRGAWRDGDGEVGAYGMRHSIFAAKAAELGYGGADWRDSDIQDIVATALIKEQWDEFRDWDLVAYAWIGGAKLAEAVENDGTVAKKQYLGVPLSRMVDGIIADASVATSDYGEVDDEMPYTPEVPDGKRRMKTRRTDDAKTQLVSLFDAWGKDLAGGERVDYRTLSDDIEGGTEVTEDGNTQERI